MRQRTGVDLICELYAGVGVLLGAACSEEADRSEAVRIFAAASTTDAVTELAASFEETTGTTVVCNFAASSTLARQVIAGAAFDIYLSANPAWMDELEHMNLIDGASRRQLLANRLVLIADREGDVTLPAGDDPRSWLARAGRGRMAVADPSHVPAGMYARQALEHFHAWDTWADRLIPTADVRAALVLVELGEAGLGIVYATDVIASTHVQVIGVFPETSHDPIRYPVALAPNARRTAQDLLAFLCEPTARTVFAEHGFAATQEGGDSAPHAAPPVDP